MATESTESTERHHVSVILEKLRMSTTGMRIFSVVSVVSVAIYQ